MSQMSQAEDRIPEKDEEEKEEEDKKLYKLKTVQVVNVYEKGNVLESITTLSGLLIFILFMQLLAQLSQPSHCL